MISTSTTIKASCDLPFPRKGVFAHWISPETRVRWETGPDTNLRQVNFDIREGGVETVEILHDGKAVGKMTQSIHGVIDGELLATATTYQIGDEIKMLMQLALEFSDHEGGCLVSATAQVIDLTGAQVTESHKSGWAWIFARFEADIMEHGLASS